jgi:hypothetical protein
MKLHQWVEAQPIGELTRLHLRTGIAYATVHKIYRGKRASYKTAVKLSACTSGQVTIAELCEPLPAGNKPADLRRRPRLEQLESRAPAPAKRGKRKAARKRRAPSRRARADGAAHAA